MTNVISLLLLVGGWGIAIICIAMPYAVGDPDWNLLSYGTSYEGATMIWNGRVG